MVHKYKDPKTGKIRNLTAKESEDFDYLLGAIGTEDTEEFETTLRDSPRLAYAIEEDTGGTALCFAILHVNTNGLRYAELLLQKGADSLLSNKRGFSALDDMNAIKGPYKQKFINLAYKYAKTFDEKLAIDPLRTSSEYMEERKEDIETVSNIIGKKKAGGDKCTICKVDKILYDNELLNHPKVQQIMEVANSQKVVNQLLDLTKDKEVAATLTAAIDEKYEEEVSMLLADGADPETVELISNAIYSMKIEEVLAILFSKPEVTEGMFSNSVDALITTVEAEQLQSSSKGLFGYIGEAVETMSKYLSALLEQNINGKHLEESIKALEMLLYFSQMSGSTSFVGGYHGYNGDGYDGGNGGGNNGIVFEASSNPTSDELQIIALPLNITSGSFANYAIEAY